MLQVESVNQLLAEVGPVADLLVVDFHPTEGVWHIAVDNDVELFVEMAASRGVIVVSGQIGTPAGGDIKALYELFLRYAHAWEASEGLRMSLDAPDGKLWLLFDCAPQDRSAADLGQLITGFASRLRAWREIVVAHGRLPADPAQLDALIGSSFLRG